MNEGTKRVITSILKPMSWLYGMVTGARNWMFDHGVLRVKSYDVPVISVGNITVGGTGKTPHVEYITGMLSLDYKMAVLSRGYKRKTRGFILANSHSTPESVGDEPLQIFRKFGKHAKVAVCENRNKGIQELLRLFPDIELIVLDDAFQHRYVKPKISVLLMDYNKPIYEDHLLPLGRLRENPHQINRADMVVVTKCPENITPIDCRLLKKNLDLMPYQQFYMSRYAYGDLQPVFPNDDPYSAHLSMLTERDTVFLLTGVANPRSFVLHFQKYPFKVKVCHFPDHHNYSREDLKMIEDKFSKLPGERKIIVTTEKDAVRLSYNPYYPPQLKAVTYYMPIEVRMMESSEDADFITNLKKEIDR